MNGTNTEANQTMTTKTQPLTNEERINTEEVARIASEDTNFRDHLGHELDLCDEELENLYQRLRSLAGFEDEEAN